MICVGSSLIARMMRENVVITPRRRTRPDVGTAIPVRFRVGKIAAEKSMVQRSAEIARRKEVDTVQIGNIHTTTIGRHCVVAELVDIQHKHKNIHAVSVLKESNTFAPVGERKIV